MPRDGSGVYTKPFPDVVPGTTIESAVYNGFVADVATDLNAARPIVAGGTGGNNATTALQNLGGEFAKQVVTNYDSFAFQPGSFYSAAGATSAPVGGHAFVGICYVTDNNNMVIEARDRDDTQVPGKMYVRQKKAGSWGAWTLDIQAAVDADTAGLALKVNKAGDTMTGPLILPSGSLGAGSLQWVTGFGIYYTSNAINFYTLGAVKVTFSSSFVTLTIPLVLPADPTNPLEAATKQYVDQRATTASPVFTGNPQAPTPAAGDNDTSLATTAFVQTEIAAKAVRYDAAQALTAAQQLQGRQNIYAAPFDALAFNGLQINGSCEVSQERASTSFLLTNNTSMHVQDMWRTHYNAAATLQVSAFPAIAQAGLPALGLSNAIMLQAATGLASLAAGDFITLSHSTEGYRAARLGWGTAGAQPLSIGFWVLSSIAGNLAVTVRNSGANRSYISDVVINAANTWEYKTLTIPGDTAGTWDKSNAIGLSIAFCFGSGTTMRGTANTWLASGAFATSATTNLMATTGNSVYLSGLSVLPGIELPASARSALLARPYNIELEQCMRYFEALDAVGVQYKTFANGAWSSTTVLQSSVIFKARKRALPALAYNALVNFVALYNGGTSPVSLNALALLSTTIDIASVNGTASSGVGVVGQAGFLTQNGGATAALYFDARL